MAWCRLLLLFFLHHFLKFLYGLLIFYQWYFLCNLRFILLSLKCYAVICDVSIHFIENYNRSMLLLFFEQLNYLVFLLVIAFLYCLLLISLLFLKFILTRYWIQYLLIIGWLNCFFVQMNRELNFCLLVFLAFDICSLRFKSVGFFFF